MQSRVLGAGWHGSRHLVNTAWQSCVGGDPACDQQRGGRRKEPPYFLSESGISLLLGTLVPAWADKVTLMRAASPVGALVPGTSLHAPVAGTGQGQAVGL